MTTLKRITVLLMIAWFLFCQNLAAQTISPLPNEPKVVVIPEGQSRSFMFTNRKGLFYYGETSLPNTSRFHGLSFLTHEFLEDYTIELNGTELVRSKAEAHLFGDRLVRYFKNLAVEEEVCMPDSLPLLMIRLRSKQKMPMAMVPLISGSSQQQDYVLDWSTSDKILYITRKHHLVGNNDKNNDPVWIGICTHPEGEYAATGLESLTNKSQLIETETFCPGKINAYLEGEVLIFFIISNSKNDVLKNRNRMLKNLKIDFDKPKAPIEGVRQV